ncbi:hypothetical protein XHV734_2793 [Xanthomonas hortorum pv. vitians]|nr:hypothetical protein XHV734_2793 [Xanthomonas hortorum pv. vitians]
MSFRTIPIVWLANYSEKSIAVKLHGDLSTSSTILSYCSAATSVFFGYREGMRPVGPPQLEQLDYCHNP